MKNVYEQTEDFKKEMEQFVEDSKNDKNLSVEKLFKSLDMLSKSVDLISELYNENLNLQEQLIQALKEKIALKEELSNQQHYN